MLARGFTAPSWPKKYGGGGLSAAKAVILERVLEELELPPPLVGFGLAMIGPTLLEYGTAAQKEEHLPRICRGEVRWCQGYSEPGAGSDLASLSTRAERIGDEFVVNGQKVWTSHADQSDWIFCLVRTDPRARKQEGITFLLIDMATPGVSVRKIQLISGASPFCEVFFDDVRVPLRNVVGEVNRGWVVAKSLLGHERSTIGASVGGVLRGAEADLVRLARTHQVQARCDQGNGPEGRLPDEVIRQDIARLAMDTECFRYTIEAVQAQASAGAPGPESSILKVYGSELKQRRHDIAMRILGPRSLGWEGPGFEDSELQTAREWLRSRANTIEGGTTEIQLNIIAKRVLNLGD